MLTAPHGHPSRTKTAWGGARTPTRGLDRIREVRPAGTLPDPFYDRLVHTSITHEDGAALFATAQRRIRIADQPAEHFGSDPDRQAHWRAGAWAPGRAYARQIPAHGNDVEVAPGDSGGLKIRLTAVISEAVLPRCAHEPGGVGIAQLDHLVSQAHQPNINIHVIPFRAGLHAGMDGAFSLLRFPEGLLGDVAYEEAVSGGHLTDEAPAVTRLDTLFNELHDLALGANESLVVIAQLADETRKVGSS